MTCKDAQPADVDGDDREIERLETHRRMIRELSEMGMNVARVTHERVLAVKAGTGDGAPNDALLGTLSLAFDRAARAVRQCMAQENMIAAAARELRREAAAERQATAAARAQRINDRRNTLAIAMIEAIEVPGLEREHVEALYDALEDWILAANEDDFADRPIGEMLARLCNDIGIPMPLAAWQSCAWAAEEILGYERTSPFVTRRFRDARKPVAASQGRP
jgi:hypothetical protein